MSTPPNVRNEKHTNTHERVGLLFVHGIGEQKPFEHLTSSVAAIAELLNRDPERSVTVTDNTPGWKVQIGTPTADGPAPVSLKIKKIDTAEGDGATVTFECHEVYWADLGARSGLLDTILFWLWALGQWSAPIYRDNDAAQLEKAKVAIDGQNLDRPVSQLARLPTSVAGNFGAELDARGRLGLAALAALLTLVSWSLLKRLAAGVMKSAPPPSILVQYVGDVRTFEERAKPGDTALSDPGFPRRVGIRRRMVTQMVAMGANPTLDRWYVLGHSLGSVVAYNALTEIGHTLPNYLTQAQWTALPGRLKRDAHCRKRPRNEIPLMMPSRPSWLVYDDVIDRAALFSKLKGFVTYGSPLNKFAAIWPRIVATATDRQFSDGRTEYVDGENQRHVPPSAFPLDCEWINLRAPLDPVAGEQELFGAVNTRPSPDGADEVLCDPPRSIPRFKRYFPVPQTYTTPFWQTYLLAHLNYFKNGEAFANTMALTQRISLVNWLIDPATLIVPLPPIGWLRKLGISGVALGLIALLALATTAIVVAGGGIGAKLLTSSSFVGKLTLSGVLTTLIVVVTVALGTLLIAGLGRWMNEGYDDVRTTQKLNPNLAKVLRLQRTQLWAARITVVGAAIVIGMFVWRTASSFSRTADIQSVALAVSCKLLPVLLLAMLLSAGVQAAINAVFGSPKVK